MVLLFLSGGASHIETFDPNMDAPDPYRSTTGEVGTTLPGVSFGGTFPRLARLAPIGPERMMATILHSVFDIGRLRVARGIPRELMALVESARPIEELL